MFPSPAAMSSGPGKGLKGMDTPDGTAPGLDLEPAARQIRELIGAVDDRQLAGPTPARTTRYGSCSGTSWG